MLPAGNPESIAAYQDMGVQCFPVPVDELQKANGAVGCMTGILHRDM
jgi:arginine deiminase